MPTLTIYVTPNQDSKIDSMKNHFNVKSKTDVLMKIIDEYLNKEYSDKEKKSGK